MSDRGWERGALCAVLGVQTLLYLLIPMLGSAHGWTVLSAFPAEIAADLLGGGESPWDGYDGVAAGPLAWALLQAPLLAVFGKVGMVQVLSTLAVALGATVASWLCARELLGRNAALVVAALVAFPPPTIWVQQHYGAYHVIPMLTAPLGFWILLRSKSFRAQVLGVAVLGSSVAWSLGGISVAAPLTVGWWWTRVRARSGWTALAAIALGGLLAALPLLYKLILHEPFGGLMPSGAQVASAVKPFFLGTMDPATWPARLADMLWLQYPYGHHFGLHGWPRLDAFYAVVCLLAYGVALIDRRLGAWLLVPPSALLVGLVTGWFVLYPANGVPFERDARHMVVLIHAMAFAVGGAVAAFEKGSVYLLSLSRSAAALLVLVGLLPPLAAVQAAWVEGGRPELATPYRLESRYVSGFFRGPYFLAAPQAAVQSCEQSSQGSLDCVRGVAMAMGFAGQGAQSTRLFAAQLSDELDGDWSYWVWVGRGWSEAHRQWKHPDRASESCGAIAGASPLEIRQCRIGVGWGTAQDFADRQYQVRRWLGEIDEAERVPFAEGVGVYAGMMGASQEQVVRICYRLVPDRLHDRCLLGATRNEPYMAPVR